MYSIFVSYGDEYSEKKGKSKKNLFLFRHLRNLSIQILLNIGKNGKKNLSPVFGNISGIDHLNLYANISAYLLEKFCLGNRIIIGHAFETYVEICQYSVEFDFV